ncbi:MAG: 23S rRNA (adenine(2503)-C(2))-methyltransferase RlmN [Clostridiales bacterium]|nr:23S rRNA (adenine(2503)-C(2))-methyltransferase RlmN [Clostridiales bacterium]
MRHLRSLLPDELKLLMAERGEPAYRAAQIFSWCSRGVSHYDQMTNLPQELRQWLAEQFILTEPRILCRQVSAKDGTVKYLFGLYDGHAVESVLMQYEHGRSLCISSQVGCRMGCRFCASTVGGLVRNLEAGELLDQMLFAAQDSGRRIDSLVLMGIGEPFDNYDNVVRFFRLVGHSDGVGLGLRHISVSTCGLVPEIDRFAGEGLPITLSISLHAPNNALRDEMMPINRRHSVEEVVAAGHRYAERTGRRVYFEYVMIAGQNDGEREARALGALLKGNLCHVNLIPLNPVRDKAQKSSDRTAIARFQRVLCACGVRSTVRRRLGEDIEAACGQLRRSEIELGFWEDDRPDGATEEP